jgi:uncharacterized protein
MSDVPELPFPVVASEAGVWRREGALVAEAPGHTDFYVDPAGGEPSVNAPTLLGLPPAGDFQFSARVAVDFKSQYDAGVLLVWGDAQTWGKFCFEFSPASEPMVVSVVTRGVSDDANAYVVGQRSLWMRVSRVGGVYAFHASADGQAWTLVRVFSLGDDVAGHRVGFEAQSPTGDGCTVTFDDVRFAQQRLADLRDGS